jgi:hypothetical protein
MIEVGLRDTLAREARVTRVRRLATPSWLSSRAKPVRPGARNPS